ncbi:MAG: ATP-dependent helicase [Acidimicrobiales bacterium]
MFAIAAGTGGHPSLTDEQEAAATHADGNLLIVAGAGTGKTTTLAARLAHLVEGGVPPERILLLTFSRRAAAELVSRVEATTGHRVAAACWSGTFHAVANRFLRRYGRAVGLDPSFTVLDQADAADLLALVRDELRPAGEAPRRHTKKDLLSGIWSRCVNTRQPLSEVVERWYPWCRDDIDELRAVYGTYVDRKRRAQVLDYDDLLLQWWALLRTPSVAALIADQVDHVLVDEVQDTNALQGDLLAELFALGATVTAVGDDAQAIYGFRAASVRNILDFPARFDAEVVTLTRNHRSTPEVLAAANAVMVEATERHPKELRSERGSGPLPRLVTAHDEHAQATAVCDAILQRLEGGGALRDQAVLFRATHHSEVLQVELAVRNIPFVLYGGLRFLEAAHVKDLVCTLRLVENPRDDLAWFRVLQLLDGVGPAMARRLTAGLHSTDALSSAAAIAGVPAESLDGIEALAAALGAARAPELQERPGAQISVVRTWLDARVERRHRNGEARRADLDRLEQSASGAPSLERFLTDLTLDPPSSTGELAGPPHLDDDHLTLSTIHSAKGAEWEVVHLLHLADGCLPSDLATGRPEEIEEERRLLHVAMTRARDDLWLHVPLRYHHHRQNSRGRDAHGYAQRSRFLSPAVASLCDEVLAQAPRPADAPLDLPTSPAAVEVEDFLAGLLERPSA